MNHFINFAIATGLVMPLTAAGQATNPAGAAPDTPRIESGHPEAFRANDADKLFVKQISMGGYGRSRHGQIGGPAWQQCRG
jgi:hypothetical protein